MTRTYGRSEIYQFTDLTMEQQARALDLYYTSPEDAEGDTFVLLEGEPIPLALFEKPQLSPSPHIWDGIYGTSYFDGYFIKLSKDRQTALIAHRYF